MVKVIETKILILATGASPIVPPIPGLKMHMKNWAVTSRETITKINECT